jgi:hypothetical protein
MLLLSRSRRAVLVDKISDVANLQVGALLFGQFLSERPFSLSLALVGIAIWFGLISCVLALAGEQG